MTDFTTALFYPAVVQLTDKFGLPTVVGEGATIIEGAFGFLAGNLSAPVDAAVDIASDQGRAQRAVAFYQANYESIDAVTRSAAQYHSSAVGAANIAAVQSGGAKTNPDVLESIGQDTQAMLSPGLRQISTCFGIGMNISEVIVSETGLLMYCYNPLRSFLALVGCVQISFNLEEVATFVVGSLSRNPGASSNVWLVFLTGAAPGISVTYNLIFLFDSQGLFGFLGGLGGGIGLGFGITGGRGECWVKVP
jgi:hypothetical protein